MSKKQTPLLDVLEEEPKQLYSRLVRKNITLGDTAPFWPYEAGGGTSDTVPNQAEDLRLMLNRAQSGQMVSHREGVYHDDDLPDLFKMDAIDLLQYRVDLATQMQQMEQELHEASKALEKKQADEALEEALKNRLKEEKKQAPDSEPKA